MMTGMVGMPLMGMMGVPPGGFPGNPGSSYHPGMQPMSGFMDPLTMQDMREAMANMKMNAEQGYEYIQLFFVNPTNFKSMTVPILSLLRLLIIIYPYINNYGKYNV